MTTVKELLAHLSSIMERLDNGSITIDTAKAQASLIKQSNNLLRYDLDCKKFEHQLKIEAKLII
jgi:hypothetical protein